MKLLRQYIREALKESRFKQMSKAKFTDLKQHLLNAAFLDADAGGDYDGDDELGSDAQQQLIDDLTDYLDDKFGLGEISITVKVNHLPTLPDEGYNKTVHGATYYYDGLHNIELLLASMEDGHTLRELGNAGQKIFEVVMHELLHMQQFLKFSKGKPDIEKWNEFKSSYEKAGGSEGMEGDYFFFDDPEGPSELETFAFQMANELVDSLGKEGAVSILQKQYPDHEIIKNNSASFRDIERRSNVGRPEFREMLKRAKQYAKRM
tara:strand:- start:298 stop:1086 length:789 start_codon:yes stop_codon:yes gene_type:complete